MVRPQDRKESLASVTNVAFTIPLLTTAFVANIAFNLDKDLFHKAVQVQSKQLFFAERKAGNKSFSHNSDEAFLHQFWSSFLLNLLCLLFGCMT